MTSSTQSNQQTKSLKTLVLRGSYWTFSGFAIAQCIRLVSNIIMAKLLFPEAFGLMALVMVFMQGITLFSDIGITPSIIQNKRGNDPAFLNTAWTMQVVRGFCLWFITIIGAYPYSILYGEPVLAYILPVAGISAIISGFNSTSLATANRDINLKKITLSELAAQTIALVVMICWVAVSPTVWGLVVGGLINALVKLFLSHYWIATEKNKFQWDPSSAKSLFSFGKWILLSTMLTFLSAQMDKLLLGGLLGTATLGIYSIAVMFKDSAANVVQKIGAAVLFPSFSEIIRSNDDKRLYNALKKSRIAIIIFMWITALILLTIGSRLIGLFYDSRYDDVVWMLQIFPLASFVGILSRSYQNAYLAKGKSSYITFILIYSLILQFSAIIIGHKLAGIHGVVIGLTMTGWLIYPANIITARKLNIWQPEIDIPFILVATIIVLVYLKLQFPWIFNY
jgi:O-antigen/teichoic acid export membrane protein